MPIATDFRAALAALLLGVACCAGAADVDSRDEAVRGHVRALEMSAGKELAAVVEDFEQRRFADSFLAATSAAERRELLAAVQNSAASAGGIMVDFADGGFVMLLEGPAPLEIRFSVTDAPPYAIDSLRVGQPQPPAGAAVAWDELADLFAGQERAGFSGVVHVARDGRTVLEQAYGMANPELGYATRLDTIYGIGSTPIDFTVAGIYLLAQRGRLSLDDAISRYLPGVPADKSAMSIRHLLSGQSGLPDFHDVESDWDADLAWIDRDEAVRRILAQPLLFAPGAGEAHSHSAYGLAAAIIEIVSGRAYYDFLSQEFFAPAGMQRTGMYGDAGGHALADFAVGPGPSRVGLPNIPPNWGPTSWLVLGSGGMYSTLGDMLRFYRYARSGDKLDAEYARRFRGAVVGVGGSDRGFYLFHASNGRGNEALMLVNGEGRSPEMRALSESLRRLVMEDS